MSNFNLSSSNENKIRRVAILFIVSFAVGIITYGLASQFPLKSFTIKNIELDGRGGECPTFALYDNAGLAHETYIDLVSYTGPAPLYYVDPQKINAKQTLVGCYEFPQQIQPTLVSGGITFYPLNVDILISSSSWLGAGESAILNVNAYFSDSYSEQSFAIPISAAEDRQISFEIYTTNFDFSPKNEDVPSVIISLANQVQQRWIISPVSHAMGRQYLGVSVWLEGRSYSLPFIVEIDVRPLYGMNPSTIALAAAIGSGIIGLLTIISQSIGIWEKSVHLTDKKRQIIKQRPQNTMLRHNKYFGQPTRDIKARNDPWASASYRRERIRQAREKELQDRSRKGKD